MNRPRIPVTLYTKPGCHLCEEVQALLARLQAAYPHELATVDITTNRELLARYHLTIPVVRVGEQELAAPITAGQLAAALAAWIHL